MNEYSNGHSTQYCSVTLQLCNVHLHMPMHSCACCMVGCVAAAALHACTSHCQPPTNIQTKLQQVQTSPGHVVCCRPQQLVPSLVCHCIGAQADGLRVYSRKRVKPTTVSIALQVLADVLQCAVVCISLELLPLADELCACLSFSSIIQGTTPDVCPILGYQFITGIDCFLNAWVSEVGMPHCCHSFIPHVVMNIQFLWMGCGPVLDILSDNLDVTLNP